MKMIGYSYAEGVMDYGGEEGSEVSFSDMGSTWNNIWFSRGVGHVQYKSYFTETNTSPQLVKLTKSNVSSSPLRLDGFDIPAMSCAEYKSLRAIMPKILKAQLNYMCPGFIGITPRLLNIIEQKETGLQFFGTPRFLNREDKIR